MFYLIISGFRKLDSEFESAVILANFHSLVLTCNISRRGTSISFTILRAMVLLYYKLILDHHDNCASIKVGQVVRESLL